MADSNTITIPMYSGCFTICLIAISDQILKGFLPLFLADSPVAMNQIFIQISWVALNKVIFRWNKISCRHVRSINTFDSTMSWAYLVSPTTLINLLHARVSHSDFSLSEIHDLLLIRILTRLAPLFIWPRSIELAPRSWILNLPECEQVGSLASESGCNQDRETEIGLYLHTYSVLDANEASHAPRWRSKVVRVHLITSCVHKANKLWSLFDWSTMIDRGRDMTWPSNVLIDQACPNLWL